MPQHVVGGVAEEPFAFAGHRAHHDQVGAGVLGRRDDRLAARPGPDDPLGQPHPSAGRDRVCFLERGPRCSLLCQHVRVERQLGRHLDHEHGRDHRAVLRRQLGREGHAGLGVVVAGDRHDDPPVGDPFEDRVGEGMRGHASTLAPGRSARPQGSRSSLRKGSRA